MNQPLRLLLDARMMLGRFSGVGRVVSSLVDVFAADPSFEVMVLCGNEPYGPWLNKSNVRMVLTDFTRRDRSPGRRWLWEERRLAGWIARSGADVYHATWNSGVPRRCGLPTLLTIHDLIPWDDAPASWTGRLHAKCYRHAVLAGARRAGCITTVSAFSRREVLARVPVDEAKVVVVPNGVSRSTRTVVPRVDTGKYVLYVGGHEPRKNVAGVFAAMRSYWEQYGTGLELCLTGRAQDLDPLAAWTLQRLPAAAAVRFLGHLDEQELQLAYRDARALLLLSYQEGFGLPVLEAMSRGCPVVAADRASLPEVAGGAAELVDPDDAAGVAAALRRIETDPAHRERLVAAGQRRADGYAWDRIGEGYARLYRSLLGESRENPRLAGLGSPVT